MCHGLTTDVRFRRFSGGLQFSYINNNNLNDTVEKKNNNMYEAYSNIVLAKRYCMRKYKNIYSPRIDTILLFATIIRYII